MNNLSATAKLRIAFIAILFVVLSVVGFFVYYTQLRPRSKAAPTGTPELLLSPVTNPPMAADNTIKIAVKLNPNGVTTDLYAFDVLVKFDSSKVELANATSVEANVALATDILKQQVTLSGSDMIRIVGTKTGTPFTASNQKIADITFKMKTGASFPMTFTWGNTILQVTNYVKLPLDLQSNTAPSSSSSSGGGTGPSLSFTSVKQGYQVGETVDIDVMADTNNQQIGSIGVVFTYDTAKLTYVSTTMDPVLFDQSRSGPAPSGANVSVNVSRKTAISGSLKVATVRFTAKSAGTANFAITQSSSSINTFGTTPQNILSLVNPYSVTIGTPSSASSASSGGAGIQPAGETVESKGDVLYINSTTFDQAPLRYEQIVQLDKGDYILSASALTYTLRGRGALLAVACAESDCAEGKKLNDIFAVTPNFTSTTSFVRHEITFHVTDNMKQKKLAVRVFVDDGSEAEFDFISLTDVWGGEKLENYHFEKTMKVASQRQYPQYWEGDTTGWMYANVDKLKGTDGSLYINSSSRK